MLGKRGCQAHQALKRLPELIEATSGCGFNLLRTSSGPSASGASMAKRKDCHSHAE
jgi:hypothetical protein